MKTLATLVLLGTLAATLGVAQSVPPASSEAPTATRPAASAPPAGAGAFSWGQTVLAPLARFAGIALILYLVILGLNLKNILLPGAWSERTIIALAIVLTFCAVLLLDVRGEILSVAKDVALIVLGFYFGASKGSQEGESIREAALKAGFRPPGSDS